MEMPDVKKEAHKQLDGLGTILGIMQIAVDEKGHVAVCVGGVPEVIVRTLAHVMQDNHQIKELFLDAWCGANDTGFNPNMN